MRDVKSIEWKQGRVKEKTEKVNFVVQKRSLIIIIIISALAEAHTVEPGP